MTYLGHVAGLLQSQARAVLASVNINKNCVPGTGHSALQVIEDPPSSGFVYKGNTFTYGPSRAGFEV